MKRFALIGCPVAGSLSPQLFAAAYGGRFPYELVETPSFDDAWARFLASYDGINVTAPFKVDAFRRCDWLSPEARCRGAVNLVVRDGPICWGYNTDVDGVTGASQECPDFQALVKDSRGDALVVGTGGAARAAVVAAQRLSLSVTVAGRSEAKLEAFRESLGCAGVLLSEITELHPDIVIYTLPPLATSCHSEPLPSHSEQLSCHFEPLSCHSERSEESYFSNAIVLEAEYHHPALAGVPCRAYLGGRRWLLWQAVAGYRLFTGEEPDVTAMEKALL